MTADRIAALVLLDGSLQSAIAGLALAAIAAIVRRRSAAIAHALLGVALLKFAIPPALAFPAGLFGSWNVVVRFQAPDGGPSAFWKAVLAVWLAGALVVASRRLVEIVRLRRIVRDSSLPSLRLFGMLAELAYATRAARVPRLRLTTRLDVPCTFAHFAPVILLPASLEGRLTDDELRGVLLHELGHVRRFDSAWNLLSALLGVVFWFHPVFHLVDRMARATREERCDEDVLASGALTPHEYAGAILAAARSIPSRRHVLASAAGGPGRELERRMRRIASMIGGVPSRRRALAWAAAALAAALLLPGAARSDAPPERTLFVHGPHDHAHRH